MNENDYVGFGPATDGTGTRHEINHLPVNAEWVDGIYQWEANDYIIGGRNGVDNLPTQGLANRTEWLKAKLEALKDDVAAIGGNDKYNEIVAMIKALDAGSQNSRINHLERLVGNLYQDIQAAGIDPDGYDNALFETFSDGADEIDQTVVTVKSVVSGDDSIDVEDSSNLIIGAHYQLTDGEKTEEVQVKSINVSGSIKRVVLYENVKNQYTEGRTKLYRSSIAIYNGRAYGGGNTSTQEITGTDTFSGSNTKKSITSTLNLSSADGLSLDGAEVSDGKVIIGGRAIGVALMSDDGGTWKQVDEEGDALV
ncbi:hypothetical protein LIQ52_00515 [Mitsuokella jalaludinii]|uniref:hypothetical protein n=1 Tax=Mitsuokella jalaludinii TaxID=187979 RepID=UPI001D032F3A|nr:hypothetical protein [Mitsuokella jalaludinii]MCB5723815.1 hypothetical protein [Mitsuokella jalaludinii]